MIKASFLTPQQVRSLSCICVIYWQIQCSEKTSALAQLNHNSVWSLLKRYAHSLQDCFTHRMVAGVCYRLGWKEKTDVTLFSPFFLTSLLRPIYISNWLLFTKWPVLMTDIFFKHWPGLSNHRCRWIKGVGRVWVVVVVVVLWGVLVKLAHAQSIYTNTNTPLQGF